MLRLILIILLLIVMASVLKGVGTDILETFSDAGYKVSNHFLQKPQMQSKELYELDRDMPWYLTLVNKQNHIPEGYQPELVELKGGERVDKRIYDPLMEMLEGARELTG